MFWDVFFVLLIWLPIIFLWMAALADIVFRREDLSGWLTAGWLLFIIICPIIGSLVYFIVRPIMRLNTNQSRLDEDSDPAATGLGVAEEIERLNKLTEQGVITREEFNRRKAWLLG
jgi:hypothetical protein